MLGLERDFTHILRQQNKEYMNIKYNMQKQLFRAKQNLWA